MVGSVPAFTTQFCFCSALEIGNPKPVGLFRVGLKTQVFTSFLLLALKEIFEYCGQRELYNLKKGAL
jgi:hypothetical protein